MYFCGNEFDKTININKAIKHMFTKALEKGVLGGLYPKNKKI